MMDSVDVNLSPLSDWVIVKVGNEKFTANKFEDYRLRYGLNSIGRHSASDLKINSMHVSRHHAEITVPENGSSAIELKDLNSINGTLINQTLCRASTAILKPGDIVSFGAEYDEEDVFELPIYCFQLKPLDPTNGRPSHNSPVAEIVISDDDEEADKDIKPVIIPVQPPEKIAVSNILTIFGNADETILDGLQRINPTVCEAVKKTSNAELVILSSDDEELDIKQQQKLEQKKPDVANEKPNESKKLQQKISTNEAETDAHADDIVFESDSDDENQMIYSQALIDEMKSEMVDESDENDEQPLEEDRTKSGTCSPQIISLIDDEDDDDDEANDVNNDDLDEDLERKVSNWTNLLINSQIFPKMNCSQILMPDDQSDEYSNDEFPANNQNRETAASEDSMIENLFRPLEEKLEVKKTCKKRTNDNKIKENLIHSPVIKNKKRKVMRILDDSEESDQSDEEPIESTIGLESTKRPSLENAVEINRKKSTPSKPIHRGPPQIVSPPHLKFGRRKSIPISPKERANGFMGKKRRKPVTDPHLKELRKERLKVISSNETSKTNKNDTATAFKERRDSTNQEHKNTMKVKNTLHNRGAFLCEVGEVSKSLPTKKDSTKPQIPPPMQHGTNKETGIPTPNALPLTFFEQDRSNLDKCLAEVKKVIRKNAEQARARNAPKKLRFADVEKSYDEQRKIEEKKEVLALKLGTNFIATSTTAQSTNPPERLTPTTDVSDIDIVIPNPDHILESVVPQKPKKTVRFKDEPTIYYFESCFPYSRKVDRKDLMPRLSYRSRRNMIRRTFPFVDRTDDIISLILAHSNEWLQKQSTPVTALATVDKISPIPNTFESFEHYKRIVFPLMKLEYMSSLQRDMETYIKTKTWNLILDDIINNKERILIVAKSCGNDGKQIPNKKCDLVLLIIGERKLKVFGYMVSCKKAGIPGHRYSTSVFVEILPNSIDADYLRHSKLISIQTIIDNLQVTIGAYNAIYKLEMTPLYEMLLNPTLLLNPTNILPTLLDEEVANEIIHDNLNTEQLNAIKQIYKKICYNKTDTTPNLSLIQGPPGTGKSVVVINLALQIIYGLGKKFRDKKILICAQSNCAIDSVAAKLLEARTRIKEKNHRFHLVRFGIFEKMHPKVHPVSLHNMLEFERVKKLNHNLSGQFMSVAIWKSHLQKLEDELKILQLQSKTCIEAQTKLEAKKREIDLLNSAYKNALSAEEEHNICKTYLGQCNIVCTTLSSCVKLFNWVDYFDVCIIDEATQCTEPWTLLPLKFGISSLVLVGDSQQLPATVLSKQAAEYGLSRSLHTRIENSIIDDQKSSDDIHKSNVIFSLRVQYRMHPEICKFPNSFFYKNMLLNSENTLKNTTSLMPYSVFNLEYAQNKSSGQGKIINYLEADFVVELLKTLNEFIPIDKNTYGVITPYAHQRKILAEAVQNARLPHVTVNTIDSYQGIEKDVIVISNARTNGIGFLANPQRLNVAITRPKKCLILCGNFRNLQSVPAWRCLLKDAQQRNVYYDIDALDASDIKTKVIQRIMAKNLNKV